MTAHILVVEDDPNILLSLEFLLQNAGHQVSSASDGAQGWALLLALRPDLAVLDVMLPGLDGLELCRRIRAAETLSHTRVLMLSARGGESDVEKSLQLGADAHMRKPFGTHLLLDTVSCLLSHQRGT